MLPSREAKKKVRIDEHASSRQSFHEDQRESKEGWGLKTSAAVFCLLNISEGRNFALDDSHPTNLFVQCRFLTSGDIIKSQTCWNSTRPQFRMVHYVPVHLDDEFLKRCQDNFLVIEVWNIGAKTKDAVGVAMVPLHQLYLSFKVCHNACHC